MRITNLVKHAAALGLLLLPGCEATRSMRDDFARLTSSQAAAQKPQPTRSSSSPPTRARPAPATPVAATSPEVPAAAAPAVPSDDASVRSFQGAAPISLAGKSESELRAMLGAPTSEEDRPPGKRWRYRDGQCTLDVQLYPDVRTKQFGTLAYEVKSDDNSDEGKRSCLAQLQSRAQNRYSP
jgi:hypothetical protein